MTKTRIGLVIVTVIVIGAIVCGCQEEQASQAAPDSKESRLVGAENVQLKGQIETLKKQIDSLQAQLEQQKQQTTKCEQQIKTILEQTEKQLLKQALLNHRSTRDIAKAMKVNQSTIVRKLKKYNLSPSLHSEPPK